MKPEAVFWKGRKVALTGATGFLGYHTASILRGMGSEVLAIVRKSSNRRHLERLGVSCQLASLDDGNSLAAAFSRHDLVIHLAGAVDFSDSWNLCKQVNVGGTRNVLGAALLAGVRRVVHVSSIVAVGASTSATPLTEDSPWTLGSYRVPYVTTKREAEMIALSSNRPECDVVVVNPGCLVGPEDFASSEFGTMCRRFWKGRLPFYFAGSMNIADVRDTATGILLAAERGRAGRRYLLTGHNLSQGEFFRQLARTAQRFYPRLQLPVMIGRVGAALADRLIKKNHRRPYLSSGQARLLGLHFTYDHSRACQELDYAPRTLEATLSDTHAFWNDRQAA